MSINSIIFDLDGTLLNTLKDLQISVNYALYPYSYPKQTIDQIRENVGNGIDNLIERSIPNGTNNPNFEKCLEGFKKHYTDNMTLNTEPYPQILEMLATLKSRGYNIAVISNKFDVVVEPLCRKYFKNIIDICIGQSKEILKKPAPDSVYIVMDEFGVDKENIIFVGDSDVDIMTAKNAGIKCISVSWGYKTKEFLKQKGASIIIDTPLEIFNYL